MDVATQNQNKIVSNIIHDPYMLYWEGLPDFLNN